MNFDRFNRLLAATLTTIAIAGSNVSTQTGELQPLWSITVEDHQADGAAANQPMRQAWSAGGTCFAISTAVAVHVVDAASGRERWRWNFRSHNRLIRAGSVAVSPQCDTVAVGGDTNYKYIWIAKRTGRPASLKTTGSPTAVVFSKSGDMVAVRTASPPADVYLASVDGRLIAHSDIDTFPIQWPYNTAHAGDPAGPEFAFGDAVRLESSGVMGLIDRSQYSDDGRWILRLSTPPHGSVWEYVSLLTPLGALAWSKTIACADAIIAPDGRWALLRGEIAKREDAAAPGDPCAGSLYLLDRNGTTVRQRALEQRGHLIALPRDSDGFLFHDASRLQRYDLQFRPSWWINAVGDADVTFAPDGTRILIREGTGVRLFKLPRPPSG